MTTSAASALPALELSIYLSTVDAAVDWALARRPDEGLAELRYGLERAVAAMEVGEPWGPELVQRFRKGIVDYRFRHRAELAAAM
jgi:hypothetical protein